MTRKITDFSFTERKHGDKITVDLLSNGGALIQIALKFQDVMAFHAIRLPPRKVAALVKALKARSTK